jgi:hypothetical protein
MRKPRLLVGALLVPVLALAIASLLHSGSFLVVEKVHKADAILVLAGDVNDRRYQKGIELLREGYGQQLFVDASDDVTLYGHSYADWARQFVSEGPEVVRGRVRVCPIRGDSTVAEAEYASKCLSYLAPASDPTQFGVEWWRHREWAKNGMKEWQKLAWWEIVERWL